MANKGKSAGSLLAVERGTWSRLWRKISKDQIAFLAFLTLIVLYLMIAVAGFLAPYSEGWFDRNYATAPPTHVYMIDGETGGITWPYVYQSKRGFDQETFEFGFTPDTSKKHPVQFFVKGEPYKLLGLIPGDIHLFGVEAPGRICLLGTDINGRDNFSRLLYGGQISLTIGFLGLFIAFPIGLIYGGISGYFGGWIDNALMRVTEVIMSIPSLYLLISLAAIIPAGFTSAQRFAMVVVSLAFIGWAGLSRVIRGMVLTIKEQEYVESARAIGLGALPIVIKHVLPQTASYVIIAITMGVPDYILAESGLSFLGLGIQQPDASWGNMLKEAQEITNLMTRPWMMMPGVLIFLAVLAFNVMGDAVRDVLDPKSYIRK
ncbi:MAG: ABC transporter permease [Vampirovibrio sp.]|nr:ABC transporter permease [Vampirovibrio sp.]